MHCGAVFNPMCETTMNIKNSMNISYVPYILGFVVSSEMAKEKTTYECW